MCDGDGPVRIELVSMADGLYLAMKGAKSAKNRKVGNEGCAVPHAGPLPIYVQENTITGHGEPVEPDQAAGVHSP